MTQATAEAVIEVHPLAERLRFKGGTVLYTTNGVTLKYRVAKVSMPDKWGRCALTLEPIA